MKNQKNGTTPWRPEIESWKHFLTPNSVAVVERMSRDHRLSPEEIVRATVDESLYQYEGDIAADGKWSGGENEWYLIKYAHRLRRAVFDWDCCVSRHHRPGSRGFYRVFGRKEVTRLRRRMGALKTWFRR